MAKIKLLLAIHSHQPVGNFEGVFEEAYEKAYLPFLETISKHYSIKVTLHYSGGLLDWLLRRHPDFIAKIKELVNQGRCEILAGGYFEPILPIIPEEDAIAQIGLLKAKIKEIFSYDATGAWLTERVWEPRIPYILARSGITYTIVDDAHFKFVAKDPDDLRGYYISEEQGRKLFIFPGSEKLRYTMPFRLPQETIDYLRIRKERNDKDTIITFADDGEKFGLWPGTNKWVYREGWLENFLTLLEQNKEWIELQTFSQCLRENSASGKIYLGCASYREMLEWSEGYFRNFFIRYNEADNMHKKMYYISNKLHTYANSLGRDDLFKARSNLYMAQANDAYWHGVFGGLYLNHLRSNIHSYLIEAEKIIDNIASKKEAAVKQEDINFYGEEEILINTKEHNLYFMPQKQGVLYNWDYKPRSLNITNTIMRSQEKYHQRLREKITSASAQNQAGISSIHDAAGVKEEGLLEKLCYDLYPRYSLIEHFLDKGVDLETFSYAKAREAVEPLSIKSSFRIVSSGKKQPAVEFFYSIASGGLSLDISKSIVAARDITVNYSFNNSKQLFKDLYFGVEFNFSLYDPNLSMRKDEFRAKDFSINDIWYGVHINFSLSNEALIWHFPVQTVSDSESGIESIYQGLCVLMLWDLSIVESEKHKLGISIGIE